MSTYLEKCKEATKEEIAKQWKDAGTKVGLEIWRIEKFQVVLQPKDHYGAFFTGDSYIVLNTFRRPGRENLEWDIHFWLGKETSQDEMGVAAYKTVELDDYLGGGPIQHREVQGHESELFQSYFPKGIRILSGGIETGFNKVKPKEYKPRLLQVKGRKRVRLVEVALDAKSVNSGDVFVLDLGLLIIQFNGKDSRIFERNKATEICRALDDERGCVPEVVVFDEFTKPEEWPKEWVDRLGKGPYATAEEGGDDLEFEKAASARTLLRLSNASGKLEMTKVLKELLLNVKCLIKMMFSLLILEMKSLLGLVLVLQLLNVNMVFLMQWNILKRMVEMNLLLLLLLLKVMKVIISGVFLVSNEKNEEGFKSFFFFFSFHFLRQLLFGSFFLNIFYNIYNVPIVNKHCI